MVDPLIRKIAELIDKALLNRNRKEILYRVAEDVADLCEKFPVYKNNLIEP